MLALSPEMQSYPGSLTGHTAMAMGHLWLGPALWAPLCSQAPTRGEGLSWGVSSTETPQVGVKVELTKALAWLRPLPFCENGRPQGQWPLPAGRAQ